jgi:hypothetical protein
MNRKIKTTILRRYCISILIILTISLGSCSLDLPENGSDYLAPPVIIDCSQDGDTIIVQFQGSNNEYYFDGYDVFVSTTYMQRASVGSYRRVQISGYASTIPSFPLSPDDYDPSLTRSMTLYQYNQYQIDTGEFSTIPFSNGTYYIMICSHHRYLGVNENGVSNQVQITLTGI